MYKRLFKYSESETPDVGRLVNLPSRDLVNLSTRFLVTLSTRLLVNLSTHQPINSSTKNNHEDRQTLNKALHSTRL